MSAWARTLPARPKCDLVQSCEADLAPDWLLRVSFLMKRCELDTD